MIPNFKTYINETYWSGMNKRSQGTSVRKEDYFATIAERIENEYKWITSARKSDISDFNDDCICVWPVKFLSSYSGVSIKRDMSCVEFSVINPDKYKYNKTDMKFVGPVLHNLFDKLNETFSIETYETQGLDNWIHFKITPKDGKKVNGNFYFTVLDFILDNIQDGQDIEKFITKK